MWPLVALLSPELAADADVLRNLTVAGWHYVHVVRTIKSPAAALDAESVRAATGKALQPHKMDVFTKFRIFEMVEFDRVLFLDADTVVVSNVDHLLVDSELEYAAVPSLVHMADCVNRTEHDRSYLFEYKEREYCQGHTLEPYHGISDMAYSNTGVLVIKPSLHTFAKLLDLLSRELSFNDSCIGTHGCNDQRLINIYYHERAEHAERLGLAYNVDCDQLVDEDYVNNTFEPKIGESRTIYLLCAPLRSPLRTLEQVHYRGHSKPWVLDDDADRCRWKERDRCGSFAWAFEKFERQYLRQVRGIERGNVDQFLKQRCRRGPRRLTDEERESLRRDKRKCRTNCVLADGVSRRNTTKCDKFCKDFDARQALNRERAFMSPQELAAIHNTFVGQKEKRRRERAARRKSKT